MFPHITVEEWRAVLELALPFLLALLNWWKTHRLAKHVRNNQEVLDKVAPEIVAEINRKNGGPDSDERMDHSARR